MSLLNMKKAKLISNTDCKFCKGQAKFSYKLNDYDIYTCKNCSTSFVQNMPSIEELSKYYDGFSYCINENNKNLLLQQEFNEWLSSYGLPDNAKMLDIGGGGGYFSNAFEHFGFGLATYIDLDPQACNYVKENLNIHKVINANVCELQKHTDERYDFIYCRHLIEHLTDPLPLIDAAINLLNDNGVFVLQFPNGISIERLAYKPYYKNRRKQFIESNSMSKHKAFRLLHSRKTGFGLDPLRHLWAISPKGIRSYLSNKKDIEFNIFTASITDKIYSPYFPNEGVSKCKRALYRAIGGGAHLVCEIRKKKG